MSKSKRVEPLLVTWFRGVQYISMADSGIHPLIFSVHAGRRSK